MKELTYAVFIVKEINGVKYLFMAHSTGNNFWDVPKVVQKVRNACSISYS